MSQHRYINDFCKVCGIERRLVDKKFMNYIYLKNDIFIKGRPSCSLPVKKIPNNAPSNEDGS